MGSLLRPLLLAAFCAFLPSGANNVIRLFDRTSGEVFAQSSRCEPIYAMNSDFDVV